VVKHVCKEALLSIWEPSEVEELRISFSNASRASSLYHGHQMVVAFHYPENPVAHLCLQLLTWLRKCCNTVPILWWVEPELLLIATTTSSADLSRFLKAV
jgi:hypothetical protein